MTLKFNRQQIIYSLVLYGYLLLVRLAAAAGSSRAGRFLDIRRIPAALPEGRRIWIHAASAGEASQAVPLARALKRCFGAKVVLSVFSPSGYDFHRDSADFDAILALPVDLPGHARRFVERVRPEIAVFVRNELWRNYLEALNEADIPVFLVNAPQHVVRPDNLFTAGYIRGCLRKFTAIFPTGPQAADGLPINDVAGNTKWEAALEARPPADPVIAAFLDGAAGMIAGSTWPDEEELLHQWLETASDRNISVVIAPHEISPDRINSLQHRFDGAVLYSEVDRNGQSSDSIPRVLIIDKYHVLAGAYPAGRAALVGGGFGPGIHNVLEAVVCGIPVVFGPNHGKFEEAGELICEGVGFEVKDADSFNDLMDRLLNDVDLRSAIHTKISRILDGHIGISDKIAQKIKLMIS